MGRRQKEGEKGSRANFMTRNQALKKLQISLPEFRKLCILKGIYPREPLKAPQGKDKTYYFKKDILFLMHEPLLQKFRENRIWKRKVKKAKDKNEQDKLKALRASRPRYSLTHLVKERYPTFPDALRDFDDALSTVFLFANMPATVKIPATRVHKCQELALHWNHYVSQSQSLSKVFVSIKGTYFQALISPDFIGDGNSRDAVGGNLITVTWLVPFTFTQKITKEVDYKVMLAFLEFYEVFVGFVLYKLYTNIGKKYPPQYDTVVTTFVPQRPPPKLPLENKDSTTTTTTVASTSTKTTTKNTGISSVENGANSKKKDNNNTNKTDAERIASLKQIFAENDEEDEEEEKEKDEENEDEEDDDEGDDGGHELDNFGNESTWNEEKSEKKSPKISQSDNTNGMDKLDSEVFGSSDILMSQKQQEVMLTLFKNCLFWLSRETPIESLQFVIRSFGGKVAWEGAPLAANGEIITENDERITHCVTDRGSRNNQENNKIQTREFVQPQYIYDSVNSRLLLPTELYKPGVSLPPHLSPFVDDAKEGYIPEFRKKIDELFRAKYGMSSLSTDINTVQQQRQLDKEADEGKENDSDEDDNEERYARELQAEQNQYKKNSKQQDSDDADDAPMTKSSMKKRKRKEDTEKEEQEDQKEVAQSLLPKKKRRLLQRIQYGQRLRESQIAKLELKKTLLEEGKATITKDSSIVYEKS